MTRGRLDSDPSVIEKLARQWREKLRFRTAGEWRHVVRRGIDLDATNAEKVISTLARWDEGRSGRANTWIHILPGGINRYHISMSNELGARVARSAHVSPYNSRNALDYEIAYNRDANRAHYGESERARGTARRKALTYLQSRQRARHVIDLWINDARIGDASATIGTLWDACRAVVAVSRAIRTRRGTIESAPRVTRVHLSMPSLARSLARSLATSRVLLVVSDGSTPLRAPALFKRRFSPKGERIPRARSRIRPIADLLTLRINETLTSKCEISFASIARVECLVHGGLLSS